MDGLGEAVTRRMTSALQRVSTTDGAARAGTTHRRMAWRRRRLMLTSTRRCSNYGSTTTMNRASIVGGLAVAAIQRMTSALQRISTTDGAARAGTTHRRMVW